MYIKSVFINSNSNRDRYSSFFGNVNSQIEEVCEQIASDSELKDGFDAMGFSQGGQFLRGYIERCNNPPVRNLVTWGSQHLGISDVAPCKQDDFLCERMTKMIKNNVWSYYTQNHLVPAQYFRNPDDLDNFVEHSNFLADINNERRYKHDSYKKNLMKLERFVMILFEDDTVVIPKESSWFGSTNESLFHQDLFIYDWLGIKELYKQDRLVFISQPGEHMQINKELLSTIAQTYLGSSKSHKVTFQPGL